MIITYTILNFGDLLGSQLTNALVGPTNEVVVMVVVEFVIVGTVLYAIFVVNEPSERYSSTMEKESLLGEYLYTTVV